MRLIVILTLVCVFAALTLGMVYDKTAPLIAAQKGDEIKQALKEAMPNGDKFIEKEIKGIEFHEVYKHHKLIGYVISAKGKGYSGDINMLVGVDTAGTITGLEITEQQETPGLGSRCTEIKYGEKDPWFIRQFKKKKINEISLDNIDTITGATITSTAILSAVKKDITNFLNAIAGEK